MTYEAQHKDYSGIAKSRVRRKVCNLIKHNCRTARILTFETEALHFVRKMNNPNYNYLIYEHNKDTYRLMKKALKTVSPNSTVIKGELSLNSDSSYNVAYLDGCVNSETTINSMIKPLLSQLRNCKVVVFTVAARGNKNRVDFCRDGITEDNEPVNGKRRYLNAWREDALSSVSALLGSQFRLRLSAPYRDVNTAEGKKGSSMYTFGFVREGDL